MLRDLSMAAGASLAALVMGCGGGGETAAPVSTAPCDTPRFAEGRDSVQCGQLVDAGGRVIFLHGVNARVQGVFDVTFDDGRTELEPIPPFTAADAARMRAMGLDALRLPINWSALEPTEDGGFDEAYLDRVQAVVDLCAAADIRVLLDFHQERTLPGLVVLREGHVGFHSLGGLQVQSLASHVDFDIVRLAGHTGIRWPSLDGTKGGDQEEGSKQIGSPLYRPGAFVSCLQV